MDATDVPKTLIATINPKKLRIDDLAEDIERLRLPVKWILEIKNQVCFVGSPKAALLIVLTEGVERVVEADESGEEEARVPPLSKRPENRPHK